MPTANKVEIDITADPKQAVAGIGAVKQELTNAGAKGVVSADQIKTAWGVLGAKSFADVKAEINKVNAALETIKANSKNPLEIKAATEAARAKIQGLEDGLKSAKSSAGGLGAAFGQIGPLIAASFTGRELVQTITQADSLKRGLTAIAGSTKAAEAELAFIKKTSNELGTELNSTGQAYLQLTAATKGTEIEGQKTKDIFTSVSRAMSVLGKSTAETELALRAVSQIASKGTVSMEELRGQLGEALPGALKASADGLGVTTAELIKMVESGSLLAKDLLPALSKNLDSIYANGGPPDSLVAQFNRFKNKVSEIAIELGESGLTKALSDLAVTGAETVGVLGKGFVGLGKGIGTVAAAITTMDFKPLAEDIGLTNRAMDDFSNASFDALGNFIGQTQAASSEVAKLAGAVDVAVAAETKLAAASADFGNVSQDAFRKIEIAAQNSEAVLSNTAKNAVAQFDKLKTSGDTAAEALAKIGKDFDLSTAPGIRDAANVLNKLVADGKISADQFKQAWQAGLKGVDLQDFEAKAKKAFEGTNQSVKVLADVLDQGLREAVKRAGLDFDVISGGMGKAARSAIADTNSIIKNLDGLKAQGVDTAQVLTASIGKSINTADGVKAIGDIKAQIESLRASLGNKVTDGLLQQATDKAKELALALDAVKPGINSVAEAMKQLGVTSDASLRQTAATSKEAYDVLAQSGKASARELGAAFVAAANQAIAANGGIAPSWVQAQAAARGYEIAVDEAGKTTLRAMGGAKGAVDALGGSVRGVTADLEKQSKVLDEINAKYGQSKADRDFKTSKAGDGTGAVTGNTREQRLAGQNAVDNTLIETLKAKYRKGTLTKEDAAQLRAVIAALEQNEQVFRDLDRYNPGGISTEGLKSRNENRVTLQLFNDFLKNNVGSGGKFAKSRPGAAADDIEYEFKSAGAAYDDKTRAATEKMIREALAFQASKQPGAAAAPASNTTRTVNVNIRNQDGTTSTVQTDDAGAAALIKTLQNARLAA